MARLVQKTLTVAQLSNLLRFDPETGKLFWLPRSVTGHNPKTDRAAKIFNTRFAHQEALTADDGRGGRAGMILGVAFKAGPVAWALSHGEWPQSDVVHDNGDKSDYRPSNLSLATRGKGPRAVRSDSQSGVKGVRVHRSRWNARGRINGRTLHLGNYDTQEQAAEAVRRGRPAPPAPKGRKVASASRSERQKKHSA